MARLSPEIRKRSDQVQLLLVERVALPLQDPLATLERVLDGNANAGAARECFGDGEGLGQEALEAPRATHQRAILGSEFIETQHRDHVFEIAVAGEGATHLAGDLVVALPDDVGIEQA